MMMNSATPVARSKKEKLISFVLPARDEIESLPTLFQEIRSVAGEVADAYEIVVVDDGSVDGTSEWLRKEERLHGDVVIVRFPSSRGQSAALAAGFDKARGDTLVTLDADLQNDPADLPLLLAAFAECDLVCGVRKKRRDTFGKRVGSKLANHVRRLFLHDRFRDVGCSLRVWRRSVAMSLPTFHGFHRFIPVLAEAWGYRVVEIDVNHRPRLHGATHYDQAGRALRGFRDMVRVGRILSTVRHSPGALSPDC